MPKVSPIQSNFNSGELSPLIYGRVDFDAYKNGLSTCLNLIPIVQGPVTRRPGTYFCDEVKDSTKKTRVVAFKYSTAQAYIIEFGDQYIRFKRNNAQIKLTSQAITGITKASTAVLTYASADTYANGDQVYISGVVGMTQVNNRRFIVNNVNVGANTFELYSTDSGISAAVDSTGYTTYSSGGIVEEIYEIASPYLEADLFQLKFTQSADTLYIVHPGYAPRKLARASTSEYSWALTPIVFLDGPYLNVNITTTTLTPSAATGAGVTLTASAVTGINSDQGFLTTDVGRLIRILEGSTWGYVRITAWTSTTVVTVSVINTLTNTNAKVNWKMGLWSDTTGYPAAVVFHEDRLVFAGNTSNQQRLDGSRTGDYENFASSNTDGTVTDSHAYAFTLNSNDVQVVRWMVSDEKGLLVGTVEGEWLVRPSSTAQGLTPTNVNAKQSTPYGSYNTQAIRAGKSVLFVQKAGRKLRELSYIFQDDGFHCTDITVISEHITKGSTAALSGIKEIAWQQEPQSIVWGVKNDGTLLGMVYERDQKVLGWHRHTLGGYSDGSNNPAMVESVTVIPAADGSRDEVWLVVKRYINGATRRYIEYMTKMWEEDDIQDDAIYGDCALTYDSTPTLSISGLFHLRGQTVSILADGAAHPDKVVSSLGIVTLDRLASTVQIGFKYNSDGRTLRMDAGAADGTAQGKPQRTNQMVVRLYDTLGLKLGPTFNATGNKNLRPIPFRTSTDPTATKVPLFNGDTPLLDWDGDYTTENIICFRFDSMFPGTIIALMPKMATQD